MVQRKYEIVTERARAFITRAESRFNEPKRKDRKKPNRDSHLWEHSRLVASLARRLAEAEGVDAGPAYLTGLLHDAGKFAGGRYHEDDQPEEKTSAAAAAEILKKSGFAPGLIRRVTRALDSLYQAGKKRDMLADIVHDADFLAKFGRLGIAQFFIKSTLRGLSLSRMLTESLSKELTYAAVLPLNMRTSAGRRLAAGKAAETLNFFRGLLRELEATHGLRFKVSRFKVLPPGRSKRTVPVQLALPRRCERCGGAWRLDVSTERGIKCERLEVRLACSGCGLERRLSFCLPELVARRNIPK